MTRFYLEVLNHLDSQHNHFCAGPKILGFSHRENAQEVSGDLLVQRARVSLGESLSHHSHGGYASSALGVAQWHYPAWALIPSVHKYGPFDPIAFDNCIERDTPSKESIWMLRDLAN